jgi:general secretion pathway protein F
MGKVSRDVKEGRAFSEALEAWPRVFGPFFIAMVRAGEGSGTLQEALVRVAAYRQKQETMVAHVRAALAYPVLMALVGIGTVVFMFVFVLPKLTTIFSTMGQTLPWPTQAVIAISRFLKTRGWVVGIAVAVFGVAAARTSSWKARRRFMSRFWLKVPVLGRFVLMTELSRFCRSLEVLIKSGIPILRALGISIPILSNEVIKTDLAQTAQDLEQGATLAASLRRSKIFPTYMVSLIAVGEESGRLDDALGEVATAYEESCDEAVRVMTSLLEPLMILGMGLVVGFIVMAMLLPIFEMNSMVR